MFSVKPALKDHPFGKWLTFFSDPALRLISLTSLIFGFTSIAHENNLGATASLLAGDTTTQYGMIIGLTILGIAAGLGLTSKILDEKIMEGFIRAEIVLTIVSGFSLIFALWSYTNLPHLYQWFVWGEMFVIALLVGIEDGLILRLAERHQKNLRLSVAIALGFSNIGGGLAGALFGLVLIPSLGMFTLALTLGMLDGVFVFINIIYFRRELQHFKISAFIMVIVLITLGASFLNSNTLASAQTQTLYNDPIIKQWEGPYGLKVLTCGIDNCKLFINGQLQVSTKDEIQYHEPLVHPAMTLATNRIHGRPLNVLIAGGGDGFAAREILKYHNVGSLTIVDLDPQMTDQVARSDPLVRYNGNSLANPKVHVINADAYVWMRDKANSYYDVVIVDLVDPDTLATAKLYSLEFYQAIKKRILSKGGVIVTQSTSPWYAPRAFWTINLTMEQAFTHVIPYHWNVPSFGDWGWNLATEDNFDPKNLTIDESKTGWLTSQGVQAMLFFGKKDWTIRDELRQKGIISTLLNPSVYFYYKEWGTWGDWGDE
jgi:spermidine synthase